jgi:hypothetical protein
MKVKLLMGLLVAGAIPFVFSSCKDDEPKKTGITFEKTEEEVNESDGTVVSFHPQIESTSKGRDISVKLILDRPVSDAVVLQYSLGGTALAVSSDDELNDYDVNDGINTIVGSDKITIEKGAEEATVKITLYEDFYLEIDEASSPLETIVFTIQSVVSGPAVLPAPIVYTLSVKEDDLLVYLLWDDKDADMDMVLWSEGEPATLAFFGSEEGAEDPYEVLWVPGGYPEGEYGFGYTYYSGTNDALDFRVVMYGNVNNTYFPYFSTEEGKSLVFEGTYTLANINKWDDEVVGTDLQQIQDASKTGVKYSVSDLVIPTTGSRSGAMSSHKPLKLSSQLINKMKAATTKRINPELIRSLEK